MATFINALGTLGKLLTPPPPYTGSEYDGLEFRWTIFVFRPALFKMEAWLSLAVIIYALGWYIGKSANAKIANDWYDAHADILETQFSKPTNGGLTKDGYSDFFNFSTGRRVVASLHTVFTLRPRHDPIQAIFQFLYGLYDFSFEPCDTVTLDFKLHSNTSAPEGIFAVVRKDELRTIKRERWDLTFTKTTENKALPPNLSVMAEFADLSETIFREFGNFSLSKVLSDPKILPYLVSLSITDQPAERPTLPSLPEERERHIVVKLTIPTGSRVNDTKEFVTSLFQLVDIVGTKFGGALRPDTKSKLRKVREEFNKQLQTEATKEQKEEAEEAKRATKHRQEQARISRLSAAEQQKIVERDRKRTMRKAQKVIKK